MASGSFEVASTSSPIARSASWAAMPAATRSPKDRNR